MTVLALTLTSPKLNDAKKDEMSLKPNHKILGTPLIVCDQMFSIYTNMTGFNLFSKILVVLHFAQMLSQHRKS